MKDKGYKIIEASDKWKDAYRVFCQEVYEVVYPIPELGITKEFFSEKVFDSKFVRDFYDELFRDSPNNKMWLALDDNDRIVGGIGADKRSGYIEMRGFYMNPGLRGRGIGSKLYEKVLDFAGGSTIKLEVCEHLKEAISIYEHWGFKLDKSRKKHVFHWEPWPEEATIWVIYMVRPAGNQDDK